MRKVYTYLNPPDEWRLPVIVALGVFVGLGLHVLHISNAVSYLSDDPRTCVNCHVMNPQYATWQRSSHARAATCNDCHVPQDHFVRTYLFKANDGLRHAFMFTFRLEPQVMVIKPAGRRAVQENCIRCHAEQIHPVALRAISNRNVADQTEKLCWDCHRETPHGRVNSLASTPHARVPSLRPVVPEWIGRVVAPGGGGGGIH